MDFASKHAGFVIAAYGISALVILALCVWTIVRDRKLRAKLEQRKAKADD